MVTWKFVKLRPPLLLLISFKHQEELPSAVITTIQAAGLDVSVARQKALLRAACYGRAFCPSDFPPLLLHSTCSKLRVLNALREPAVGMPLTMGQLEALTMPVVVARCVSCVLDQK